MEDIIGYPERDALADIGAAEALEDSPMAAMIFSPDDLVMLYANAAYRTMVASEPENYLGRPMFEAFPADSPEATRRTEAAIRASVSEVRRSGARHEMPVTQHDIRRPDGSHDERHWRIIHCPIRKEGGIVAILQLSRDVTLEVLRERQSAAQRRAAELGAQISFFDYDPESHAFARDDQVDAMFGFAPGEAGPLALPFFERIHPEDLDRVLAERDALSAGPLMVSHRFGFRVLPGGGETRWIAAQGEMVRDPATRGVRMSGVFMDMTEVERTRSRLEEALAARELLLEEVNHRVKNSLQLVTSVLRLEAREIADPEVRARMSAAGARVQAIAEVHARLFRNGQMQSVAMGEFLRDFCADLARSLGAEERGVALDLRSDPDLTLETDRAIPLALILGELVTNAFKHAFGPDGGRLTVALGYRDEALELAVTDETSGAPEPAPGATSTGLGGRLIAALARQLDAELREERQAPHGQCTRLIMRR